MSTLINGYLDWLIEQRLTIGCLNNLRLSSGLLKDNLLTATATTGLNGNDLMSML
jgi:hypothetical protein